MLRESEKVLEINLVISKSIIERIRKMEPHKE